MPRRTLLLINPQKPKAASAAAEVRAVVKQHGVLLGEVEANDGPLPAIAHEAELFVVLGGDGTLLSQARRCIESPGALLGVNLGRVGFLAAFDLVSVLRHGKELFGAAPLTVRTCNVLHVRVTDGHGAPRFEGLALNDAAITAGPPYRLITLTLSVNGQPGPTIRGDGLIVASPVGSTAYNLSAGGPILSPTMDAFTITPIAAQSLSFRPVVVDGTSTIEVVAQRPNRGRAGEGTTLVLDGQVQTPIAAGDRITITRHARGVRFIDNPESSWWQRLIGKLNWAATPRME